MKKQDFDRGEWDILLGIVIEGCRDILIIVALLIYIIK